MLKQQRHTKGKQENSIFKVLSGMIYKLLKFLNI
jgi:hypothetical protein